MAQSRATKSRAKSRKNPRSGGSGVDTSTAPRWNSPGAVPSAKAAAIVPAGLASSGGASGLSRRRSRPEGETASASRRTLEDAGATSVTVAAPESDLRFGGAPAPTSRGPGRFELT